jgi:hypothetical protein
MASANQTNLVADVAAIDAAAQALAAAVVSFQAHRITAAQAAAGTSQLGPIGSGLRPFERDLMGYLFSLGMVCVGDPNLASGAAEVPAGSKVATFASGWTAKIVNLVP